MDIVASTSFSSFTAHVVVLVTIVAPLVSCVIAGLRARHRTRLAERAELSASDTTPVLAEGIDVVLGGIVRHLEDHDVAVKVSIEQAGSESESSGSWSHSWIEIDREIVVAPFLLELPDKQLVRVEPPENVDVADALDQKVWIDRNKRVLSAELVPGEHIFARGRLQRSDVAAPSSAYRDVTWGWALVPADGQMLLSSEPLGAGMRARAEFHRYFALVALLLFVGLQTSLFWFYSRAAGSTVIGTITNKRYYTTTDSDGDSHDYYEITLAPDIAVEHRLVNISSYDYARVDVGSTIPVRRASPSNWNLGESPTIGMWHGIAMVVLCIALPLTYKLRRRSSRPWFRRKVNETGPGRLPSPRP